MGGFPSFNATQGVFDGWEKISGEYMADLLAKRGGKTGHKGCSKCVIQCSNEFVDANGKFVTSSLEYETIWSMGGMTGINDLDIIARLDFLCDDLGIDTMGTGVGIAVAMDAGYRPFGDGRAAVALVDSIGLCVLASSVLSSTEGNAAFVNAINAKLGTDLDAQDLTDMGVRVLKAEREFNRRAGFTNQDDRLPRFFYEEALPPHNVVVKISPDDIDKTFDF